MSVDLDGGNVIWGGIKVLIDDDPGRLGRAVMNSVRDRRSCSGGLLRRVTDRGDNYVRFIGTVHRPTPLIRLAYSMTTE